MPSTTVAAVLEEAAARVRIGLAETHALRFRIGQAVEAYVAGVEAKQAIALAQRLGLPCSPAPDTQSTARALLEVVRQIPELRDRGAGPSTEPAPAPAVLPAPDAEADALWREAHELGDMEELFDDHFRLVAEELAARARLAQERLGDRGRDSPETRVIRRLTYLASQRGIRDIHGLKRRHAGNWSEQARLARRERDRVGRGAATAPRKNSRTAAG